MNCDIKIKAIALRKKGKTYSEICNLLDRQIPKSTLSYWCGSVKLSQASKNKIIRTNSRNLIKNRLKALEINKLKRRKYLSYIRNNNLHISDLFNSHEVSKLALSLLYITEGSGATKGSLTFGNSNPSIIKLFLKLLRKCYDTDEQKFRCTLQCRADQNIPSLELYWSKVTGIPLNKFYKARVDKRSINMASKKPEYKGVCRIDYFSAHIYNELIIIADIIYKGL
jgi:hypothetical protein